MSKQAPHRGIVVGVDGSDTSLGAVRWAALDAAMHNTPLTLIYVLPIGLPDWGMGFATAPLPRDFGTWQQEHAERILAHASRVAAEATPDGRPLQVSTENPVAGPAPTLIDTSKDAQMIVVGCRGHG